MHFYLVKDQNFQAPTNVETAVIDAMFLLKSSLSKLPGTLSVIATPLFGQRLRFSDTKQCRNCCCRRNIFTKI